MLVTVPDSRILAVLSAVLFMGAVGLVLDIAAWQAHRRLGLPPPPPFRYTVVAVAGGAIGSGLALWVRLGWAP